LQALALELPPAVWHDVNRIFDEVLRRCDALVEGPTDEQVEAAAKALYEQQPQVKDGSWPEWVDLRSAALSHWKNVARAALEAALRIEEPEGDTE
jgi:hypothetical protein